MFETLNYFQMITITFIFVINLYTFYLFYSDKKRAKKGIYRISEKHLLLSAFLLGGIGAWTGMTKFRHKTQKPVFKFCIPIAAVLTVLSLVVVLFYSIIL